MVSLYPAWGIPRYFTTGFYFFPLVKLQIVVQDVYFFDGGDYLKFYGNRHRFYILYTLFTITEFLINSTNTNIFFQLSTLSVLRIFLRVLCLHLLPTETEGTQTITEHYYSGIYYWQMRGKMWKWLRTSGDNGTWKCLDRADQDLIMIKLITIQKTTTTKIPHHWYILLSFQPNFTWSIIYLCAQFLFWPEIMRNVTHNHNCRWALSVSGWYGYP